MTHNSSDAIGSAQSSVTLRRIRRSHHSNGASESDSPQIDINKEHVERKNRGSILNRFPTLSHAKFHCLSDIKRRIRKIPLNRAVFIALIFSAAIALVVQKGSGMDKLRKPRKLHKFPPMVGYYAYDQRTNFSVNGISQSYVSEQLDPRAYTITDPDGLGDICVEMHPWMTATYPSCNSLHEFDLMPWADHPITYINSGTSRAAWMIHDFDGRKIVLKTLMIKKDFDEYTISKNLRDARVMEENTKSPYVSTMFGFCGSSQVLEYAQMNLHDIIKRARLTGQQLPPMDKLRVGLQMARGLTDLHSSDVAHRDYCCHQLIFIDGVYKINDFHLAAFLTKRKLSNTTCLVEPRHLYKKLRAPEEYIRNYDENQKINNTTIPYFKVDVYMLGNVLYNFLTNKWLFEGRRTNTAIRKIMGGKRSEFPNHFLNGTAHPAEMAMMKAIQMCWIHDVGERPTAKDVSLFLMQELSKLDDIELESLVVLVEVPELDKDHRYTDTDFYKNFF